MVDLDGRPRPLTERTEAREAEVTVGADGFSHTHPQEVGAEPRGFKLGGQV